MPTSFGPNTWIAFPLASLASECFFFFFFPPACHAFCLLVLWMELQGSEILFLCFHPLSCPRTSCSRDGISWGVLLWTRNHGKCLCEWVQQNLPSLGLPLVLWLRNGVQGIPGLFGLKYSNMTDGAAGAEQPLLPAWALLLFIFALAEISSVASSSGMVRV